MGVYDDDIASALQMIAESGALVTWRQVVASPPVDPSKPWKPVQPETFNDVDVHIVFLPLSRVGNESKRKAKDGETESGNEQGLMGAVAFEPSTKDVVIRAGRELRILNISKLAPNGEAILYTIEFLS